LLGELTELGWLDPLSGCGAPQEGGEKGTRMGGGNVRERGIKHSKWSRENGKGKGRMEPWRGGREETEPGG